MPGALYVVSTPIGNIEDLTFRAVRILRDVHFIAAENPRATRDLLDHYAIDTPLTTYHQLNKEEKTPVLLHRLKNGSSMALVCDAGTPIIADPGAFLISEALAAGIDIIAVPGASAVIAAVSVSGLPSTQFSFLGVFPERSTMKRRLVAELGKETRTAVVFIPLAHLQRALELFRPALGKRRIIVANNLTTMNEALFRGTADELLQTFGMRRLEGEVTLVIEGSRRKRKVPRAGHRKS